VRRALGAGALLFAAVLCGCAIRPEFMKRPFAPPARIAVLPFANESNNIDAPSLLQRLVWEGLSKGGYSLQALAETTEGLRRLGITDGGQLGSKKPEEIARALGVEGCLFGTVKSFKYVTLGVYQKREVILAGEIRNAEGEGIWRNLGKASRSELKLELDKAGENLARQLAVKWVEKIVSHPLYPEMQRSVYEMLMGLPQAGNVKRPVGSRVPRGYDESNDFWRGTFGEIK